MLIVRQFGVSLWSVVRLFYRYSEVLPTTFNISIIKQCNSSHVVIVVDVAFVFVVFFLLLLLLLLWFEVGVCGFSNVM